AWEKTRKLQFAPATAPGRGDPAPPPATDLPAADPAPTGRVPRREISATTRPWESHPSELPFATALRLSTCRELAQWGAYTPARRYSPSPRAMPQPAKRNTHHGDTESRRKVFSRRWLLLYKRTKS